MLQNIHCVIVCGLCNFLKNEDFNVLCMYSCLQTWWVPFSRVGGLYMGGYQLLLVVDLFPRLPQLSNEEPVKKVAKTNQLNT
jgi:hypothetical protein